MGRSTVATTYWHRTEDGPPGELMSGHGEYAALHSSWAASLA